MNYLMLGEKLHKGEDYRTARAIRVRKNQICSWCTKEIRKGKIAIMCYTLEDVGITTIQQKQYLHENCVELFAKAISESDSAEIF